MCDCTSSCDCSSTVLPIGPAGANGNNGINGINGTNGADGIFGGFSGEWVFNSSTSTGPSATQLRLNNATPASVTEIYVSDTNLDSINYDAFLDSLSNNANFGYVRIFKKNDNTKFWMGQINSVTDNGIDHTLAVTYISSNSTFSNSDSLILTFSPAGTGTIISSLGLSLTNSVGNNPVTPADFTKSTTSKYVLDPSAPAWHKVTSWGTNVSTLGGWVGGATSRWTVPTTGLYNLHFRVVMRADPAAADSEEGYETGDWGAGWMTFALVNITNEVIPIIVQYVTVSGMSTIAFDVSKVNVAFTAGQIYEIRVLNRTQIDYVPAAGSVWDSINFRIDRVS